MGDYYTIYLFSFIVACFIIYDRYNKWTNNKKSVKKLIDTWGIGDYEKYHEGDFENIATFFNHKMSDKFYIDDITWNDLEFDEIYKKLNHTMSSVGEEYLYYLLRTPIFNQDTLKKRNIKMEEFELDAQNRIALQKTLQKLDKKRSMSISDIVYGTMKDYRGTPILLIRILSIISILWLISILIYPEIGLIFLFTIFPLNMLIHYSSRKQIENNISSIKYVVNLIVTSKKCIPYITDKDVQSQLIDLYNNAKILSSIRFKFLYPSNASEDLFGAIFDYLRIITLFDLFMYSKMIRLISDKKIYIKEIFEVLGELDALISLASYRSGLEEYTTPIIHTKEDDFLRFEKAYHPLLTKPEKNTLNKSQSILITGANASGKSTFLKTIGINQIFAQTFYTVLATSYESKLVKVCTAMSVKDNILQNESYYIAEIKAVKRILDEVKKEDGKVLCIVDELLKGTNTKERIVGAYQILDYLSNYSYVYAATHDIELTDLLKEKMDNYHFQSEITNNDIYFDYRIKDGKSLDTNAIELLRIFDFNEEIISRSKAMLKAMI
ncbi:DNA mismatch repair protein MutS [Alkalibaculum sp. M08DMB]|uniref:DNA mismatch repair protein MutS n=1 Tax=Alkalibaculum sporogenes TaxID=2655001 RepID=A0A6A7K784_9FIRM|nr:DNA mismatch repair protein MutS [Alkalibaculum sporogenes]MPW25222.1 DNA mismatch repair protein MutS [Alkalibaculum sporogenes]